MIDADELPDWCRELILTDATVRFLYDDHRDNGASTLSFFKLLAHLLHDRSKVRQ